jgi:MFS transporter, FSR family, fosmidomycin resistance protein
MQLLAAPHLAAQGVPAATIGPVIAGYSIAALVFRFVLASVYTARRAVALIPLGCLLQTGAFVGIAASTNLAVLTVLVAVSGAGFALASTGGLAAIMDLLDGADAGPVMGWYTGSIGAGYSLAAFLGGWLGDRFGTAQALNLVAVIPLIAGVALALALSRAAAVTAGRGDGTSKTPHTPLGMLGAFKTTRPVVWLATSIALFINLTSGVLMTYFPLYGLTIGLSLATVGTLIGFHSAVGSFVRFATPPLFRRIHHRRTIGPMVLLSGLGVAGIAVTVRLEILLVAFLAVGLARGMLRVASAALATEGANAEARGAASGLYLAGLDIGKIIGPIVGGLGVARLGFEATFLCAAIAFPLIYFALDAAIGRQMSGPHSA